MYIVHIAYSQDDLYKNNEHRSFSKREKDGKASQCKSLALKTGKVEKLFNWKFCCCRLALVLPLDGSVREIGEAREAISKCVKLMSEYRPNSLCPRFKGDVEKLQSLKKSSIRVIRKLEEI